MAHSRHVEATNKRVGKMNGWLKYLQSLAIILAVTLLAPAEIYATPLKFGFEKYTQPVNPDKIYGQFLLVHCCHSHPYPPYDRYCCHGTGYRSPGRTAARAAVGAAATYGVYRGVRSATKSAYKKGYNKAKKNYKRRR